MEGHSESMLQYDGMIVELHILYAVKLIQFEGRSRFQRNTIYIFSYLLRQSALQLYPRTPIRYSDTHHLISHQPSESVEDILTSYLPSTLIIVPTLNKIL